MFCIALCCVVLCRSVMLCVALNCIAWQRIASSVCYRIVFCCTVQCNLMIYYTILHSIRYPSWYRSVSHCTFYLSVYVIKPSTLFFCSFVRILKLDAYLTPFLHALHHLILFPTFPLFIFLIFPLFCFIQSHLPMNYRQRRKRTASYNYSTLHLYHYSPKRWPHTILRLPLGDDSCYLPRH